MAATFKIVEKSTGKVINHIQSLEGEKTDLYHDLIIEQDRLNEARRWAMRWHHNYFQGTGTLLSIRRCP